MELFDSIDSDNLHKDGFYLCKKQVIDNALLSRAILAMDDVMDCKYETGIPPSGRMWNPGDSNSAIRKINDPHLCNDDIYELFCYPKIGKIIGKLLEADFIQIWAAQLLFKPQGGQTEGNIGWHQDKQYWSYWDGEVFTVWIALSDITTESGPMVFIKGSQKIGKVLNSGDFYSHNNDDLKKKIQLEKSCTWEEVPAILPAGGFSLHHRFTIHGSYENNSSQPRRSFALHLRTNKSKPNSIRNSYTTPENLNNQRICPVIYNK